MNREMLFGLLAGALVMLAFAGMLVMGRLGTVTTLTPYDLAGLRFAVGGVCTIPFLLRLGWPAMPPGQALAIALANGAPFALCILVGLSFAPAAHGGIVINGAMPVFAALIAWAAFADRLGPWRLAGVGLIVAGVAAAGWDARIFSAAGEWRGHLLFLGAGLLGAFFLSAVRGWSLGVVDALIVVNIANLAVYVPLWLLFLPSTLASAPLADIALQGFYHGVVAAFAAALLLIHAARTLGAPRQGAIMSGAPAMAMLMAIPALGEIPSSVSIAGAAVVTTGILVTLGPGLLRGAAAARAGAART